MSPRLQPFLMENGLNVRPRNLSGPSNEKIVGAPDKFRQVAHELVAQKLQKRPGLVRAFSQSVGTSGCGLGAMSPLAGELRAWQWTVQRVEVVLDCSRLNWRVISDRQPPMKLAPVCEAPGSRPGKDTLSVPLRGGLSGNGERNAGPFSQHLGVCRIRHTCVVNPQHFRTRGFSSKNWPCSDLPRSRKPEQAQKTLKSSELVALEQPMYRCLRVKCGNSTS